jgi:twitching motility protein PilT
MQVGQEKHGMQTLNQALFALLQKRVISMDEAIGHSQEPDELRNMLETKNTHPKIAAPVGARR